jgi:hypothetical protein
MPFLLPIILMRFVFLDSFKIGVRSKVTSHVLIFNEVEAKNNILDLQGYGNVKKNSCLNSLLYADLKSERKHFILKKT